MIKQIHTNNQLMIMQKPDAGTYIVPLVPKSSAIHLIYSFLIAPKLRNGIMVYVQIVFAAFLLGGCAKAPVFKSHWQTESLVNKYTPKEWTGKMYYDSKSRLMYAVLNDKDNLYIRLKIMDMATQQKILITGFTVWIDTTGKKKTNMGIRFPLESNITDNIRNLDGSMANGGKYAKPDAMRRKFSKEPKGMELIGFDKNGKTKRCYNINPDGVNALIDFDSLETMYYVATIPFKLLYKTANYTPDTSRLLSIGFETGSIQMPSMNPMGGMEKPTGSMGSNMPNGNMPGGGMPRGERPGSGDMPQQMTEMQAMSQPSKFWLKNIKLTVNQ